MFEKRAEPSGDGFYVIGPGGHLAHRERDGDLFAARDMPEEEADQLVRDLNGEQA